MLALQVSIGALNDVVDAPTDAGRKRGKPIPRGLARPRDARLVAVSGAIVGLGLAAPSGPPTLLLAIAGASCGYAYDLRLSRTAWSWLPLAAALPLLPIFAWVGAGRTLPLRLAVVLPMAILAGAGLSLANGLADLEHDRAAGVPTAVVRLGRRRAWILQAALAGTVVAIALLSFPWSEATRGPWAGVLGVGLVGGAASLLGGAVAAGVARPALRERAWEAAAVGTALLGASWIAGVALAP